MTFASHMLWFGRLHTPRCQPSGEPICIVGQLNCCRNSPSAAIPDVADLPPVGQAMVSAGLVLVGRREEAMAIYRPLARAASQFKGLNLGALQHLTDVGPMLGDAVGCRVLRTVISESFADTVAMGIGTVFYKGSLARWLGELDVACGDYEEAVVHLEEGLAVDAMLDAQPYVARGRLSSARAFYATGDLARSSEEARAAAADARRLDMPGVLRDAEALLRKLVAGTQSPDPLTAREREVAELVAQALSNKEVASKLVVSERTVESHVRNILTKTGLRSRTAPSVDSPIAYPLTCLRAYPYATVSRSYDRGMSRAVRRLDPS